MNSPWKVFKSARENKKKELEEEWKSVAFGAYLNGNGKQGQTFNDYLTSIGLSDRPIARTDPQKAIKIARKIVNFDKARNKK